MSLEIRITPKKDGAIINVKDLDITITVTPSEVAAVTPSPPAPPPITLDLVRSRLVDYVEDLTIAVRIEGITVSPKAYLGRDKFASIAAIIRDLGGDYISAGKDSRFVIPLT